MCVGSKESPHLFCVGSKESPHLLCVGSKESPHLLLRGLQGEPTPVIAWAPRRLGMVLPWRWPNEEAFRATHEWPRFSGKRFAQFAAESSFRYLKTIPLEYMHSTEGAG